MDDDITLRKATAQTLQESERFEEAAALWRGILLNCQTDVDALLGLAVTTTYLHDWDTAGACFYRAYDLTPGPKTLLMLTRFILLMGRFEEVQSLHRRLFAPPANGCPAFVSGSLAGKSVLLRLEHRFGDALRDVRFAAYLKQECGAGQVIVQCAPELRTLLRTASGVDETAGLGDPPPAADLQVCEVQHIGLWITNLAQWLGQQVPYLHPPAWLIAKWQRRVAESGGSRFRVGIVWQGRAGNTPELKWRSIPLEDLAGALSGIPEVQIFSLQKTEEGQQRPPANSSIEIIDLDPEIRSFRDRAAAVQAMHLVVTIDTSMAHLAGALGKRAVVLLPYNAHEFWQAERPDSPWYPSITLLRQPSPGNWGAVFEQLAYAVRAEETPLR